MKQRRAPRIETTEPIWITLFGEPDIQLPARIRNLSARGIGLELEGPVAVGSALKITLEDDLLLGEVIYCREDGGAFYVGVELEQAIRGLAELSEALRAFSDPISGTRSGAEQAKAMKDGTYQN